VRASAVTLAEVDSVLRDGGNCDSSVHRIAARFSKAKTPEEMTAYLRREYLQGRYDHDEHSTGKGFRFDNKRHSVSAWFDTDGISLAIGTTAKNNMHRVTIPWATAAERVNQLMTAGNYVDRATFDAALDNERRELADRLWAFYRDDMHELPEEWNSPKGGHPEDVAIIGKLLSDAEERRMILEHLIEDAASFRADGGRSWHNPERLIADLRAFGIPPAIAPADEYQYKRDFSGFITQDEIDAYLMSRSVDTKYDTLSAYLTGNGDKEFTDFLKHSYGLGGGGTWSDGNGWSDYTPSKGITLKRGGTIFVPEATVTLNRNQAAKRVKTLIESGLYMSREELNGITGYERLQLVKSINNFYGGLPEEYERPFPGQNSFWNNEYKDENGETTLNFHYPHEAEWEAVHGLLDDTERVDKLLAQMRYIFENTSTDDRCYNSRKSAFESLSAFQAGTYTLFPGIENLPDPDMQITTRFNGNRRETVIDLSDSPFGDMPFGKPTQPAVQMSLFPPHETSFRGDPGFELLAESPLPILPSVEEQRAVIDDSLKQEAKEVENRESEPFLNITGEDKARLAKQFADNPRSRAAVNLVKEIYGDSFNMPLPQAVQKITELAAAGAFNKVADEPAIIAETPEQSSRPYAIGDVVWLDERKFVIDEIGDYYKQPDDLDRKFAAFGYRVKLTDITGGYPLMRSMYSAEVDCKLNLDDRNMEFTPLGEPQSAPEVAAEPAPEIAEETAEPENIYAMEPEDEFTEKEMELLSDEEIPLDYETAAQEVYDRVLTDAGFAEALRTAQSRSTLRNPLNAALEKVIDELKARGGAFADYFTDDIADDLFDHVYKTAWENRPQPKTEEEQSRAGGAAEIKAPRYDIGDFITIEDTKYRINGIAGGKITLRDIRSDEFVASSRIMGIEAFEKILNDNPLNLTIMLKAEQQEEIPNGFTEITDPAELAEAGRIFGGGQRAEPLAAIGNVSRNNFNLFAAAFPRIIDGTYQAVTFRDADNRELSVSYATTNADIINLDVSYYRPDGHRAFAPMIQFRVSHENRMLTVNGYADDDRNEDAGFLRLADEDQLAELNVRVYGYLSNIGNIGFDLTNPAGAEVFLDAEGNPIPAEPKADIEAFLRERANRESDARGRVRASVSGGLYNSIREIEAGFDRKVGLMRDHPNFGKIAEAAGYLKTWRTMTHRVGIAADAIVMQVIAMSDAQAVEWFSQIQWDNRRVALDIGDFEPLSNKIRRDERLNNFRITDARLGEGGAKVKFHNNIKALQTLKNIEFENRAATPDEQEILSRYVGWGGIPQAFDPDNKAWEGEYLELSAVLTPEEFESARASTLNAHYTSPTVVKAIWETVERLGFTSGNVLEPGVGVGNFFGLLPDSMRGSKLYGVEADSVTARIAKQLYPHANIQGTGFEKTDFSDAFFDLAIGNVPFGEYSVADKRYDKHKFSIHNYFFAKALDKVRPGGVVAFVTSKYTMDSRDPKVRKYLAERAELLGAVRLPNNAFLKNAGTETTMDILFLQKRDRPLDIEPDWVHLGLTDDGIPCSRYFLDNPETVCGVMGLDAHMNNKFGRDDMTACLPIPGADLAEQLRDALANIRGEYSVTELDDLEGVDNHAIPADPSVKNFSYAVVDDTVYFRENSLMYPVDLPAATLDRIKGMIGLRTCVGELIELQLDDYTDDDSIIERQQRLNDLYDSFSRDFGLINSTANNRAFNADSAYYLLSSLEILDENGELLRKADMFTKRTIKKSAVVTHVDTAAEALAVSIGKRALVDLPYMSELTGKDRETLLEELRGVVFLNVGSADSQEKAYVAADEYLSGNVRKKLELARAAALTLPEFEINVKALEAVMPKDLEAGEINVRLGATWIEPEYIGAFMHELLNTTYYNKRIYRVQYHAFTGEWQITGKGKSQFSDIPATVTYGTRRMNAYQILEDTLNLRDVRVYDSKEDADGKKHRILNKKETMLAQQKQEIIKQAFRDWIWKDPQRRQTLVSLYNEKFNSVRPREYDGSCITFGAISRDIELRPHQLSAVAHILYGGNTLLAHEVGAGKTFEMAAAAMEGKRLGQCHKSLFAVPNHLTEQWAAEFLRLYPSANILVAAKKDFEMRNRKKFCAKIATGDYDAVIIGHSQLEKIPMSAERQERQICEQLWETEEGIRELKASNGERFSIKQLEKTKKSLKARLTKLLEAKQKDDVVTFEQLGCDRLYVDEAHNFKNLFLYTKMRNVAGLSTSEAQKSSDLFMKCRYLDELTGNKGVIFATGTPISNSITEMFTMQRYLQHDRLNALGLLHFDSWASIFGETQTSIELAPEGTGYRARTRFAKFHNLPELMAIFKDAADIQTADMLGLPVPEAKFENVIVEPSDLQKEMVEELSERAAAVHNRRVDPQTDNMLKITTDGRKIGLDQRLMNPLLPDFEGSKVNACTDKVFEIWRDTSKDRLTQLVFCDFSTPNKNGRFNVYDDIKAKLIARGIPEHEIAFIHDADTETKKKELFAKVRRGSVRVLFGSTFKLGAGTNVQDKLIAIHDADCPWRPADLAQRAGRIVRQGNKNAEVRIFRYATSGTFDSYLWQTVQKKQEVRPDRVL
jgi:N12 class adenine-specific DNA methylase/adenine-specific DNA methylase